MGSRGLWRIDLNSRLFVFSLSLGMSFGILVLYVSSLIALSLVVVLITASIVAASTNDLTAVRQEKILPIIMFIVAALDFAFFYLFSSSFSLYLFYELMAINTVLLVIYALMRVGGRRPRGYIER